MALLPKVKLKSIPQFPSNINGGAGIDVVLEKGHYSIDLQYADFAPPVAALPDPPNLTALLWNKSTQQYVLSALDLIVGGSSGNFIQAGTGAVVRTMQDKAREIVSVKDYGAVGDGIADDTSAISTAWAAVSTMNPMPELVFPAGTYKFSFFPAIGVYGARVTARGYVVLKYTGTGTAVDIETGGHAFEPGGAASTNYGVFNMEFGPFHIDAPLASTGFHINGVHHSRIDVSILSAMTYGAVTGFCVCNEFSIRCSFPSVVPAYGLVIGAGGNTKPTCWSTFNNTIIEGITGGTGIQFEDAMGVMLVGGTSENGGTGIYFDAQSFNNRVTGVDMESNTSYDVEMHGTNNSLINCDAGEKAAGATGPKLVLFGGDTHYCEIDGGTYANITVNGTLNKLRNLTFNKDNDGSVLTDNGTLTIRSNITNAGLGLPIDAFVGWAAFSPAVAPAGGASGTYAVTGKFLAVGKTVFIRMHLTASAIGGGGATGFLQITGLPRQATNDYPQPLHGRNNSGGMVQGIVGAGATIAAVVRYDGTFPFSATGEELFVGGTYECV